MHITPECRWTNLRDLHEIHCAGHMIEAAAAYHQATGKRTFLHVVCRLADFLVRWFSRGPGQAPGCDGHEEIELALLRLARVTGNRAYMGLAKFFVDERGQDRKFFMADALAHGRDPNGWQRNILEQNHSHLPAGEQTRVVGHAVRAMYLYSGMADVATEYGDDTLTRALEALWADLTAKQM